MQTRTGPQAGRQQLAVLVGDVVLVLVQVGQAHHVELDLDVPDLLHLFDPARRDPGPGAQRVEPEIATVFGSCLRLLISVSFESGAAQFVLRGRSSLT